jgi:hypothetical protein
MQGGEGMTERTGRYVEGGSGCEQTGGTQTDSAAVWQSGVTNMGNVLVGWLVVRLERRSTAGTYRTALSLERKKEG